MPEPRTRSGAQERESTVVGGLVLMMLVLWLGFLIHRSAGFPGSGLGHALGIGGALLMLVPAAYVVVKRVPKLRKSITKHVPMRTLLAWHIYAGVLGPLLVLFHTGHRFESPLATALTALTIIVVLSGYIGRYLMRNIQAELAEKRDQLKQVTAEYDRMQGALANAGDARASLTRQRSLRRRLSGAFFVQDARQDPVLASLVPRALRVVESRADLEYAIGTHERFKRWFGRWLRWHIVVSCGLYLLLGLHVWAAIYFGLRWWP